MNKSILAELRTLAQEILDDSEGKSAATLKQRALALYDRLAVLSHLESAVGEPELPTEQQDKSLDSKSYREQNWFRDPKPVEKSEHQQELTEPLIEKIKDIVAQMPEETTAVDALLEEVIPSQKAVKSDMEDIGMDFANMPVFERKIDEALEPTLVSHETKEEPITKNETQEKPKSLNDSIQQPTQLGLNDRLAFIKHLFNENPDELERVMTQLDSLGDFQKAKDYVVGKVKPAYNYWLGKEEYVDRFLAVIEKRY
ncbi:MAG: hypothetical protein ABJM06_11180 [Gilvibacter sp.]